MSCQLKFTPYCENKDCNTAIEQKCESFKPYPPKMTAQEFSTKQAEILKDVPIEFHSTLSYMAYERGHSGGHEEVICILQGLVGDLLPSIMNFTQRIANELAEVAKEVMGRKT